MEIFINETQDAKKYLIEEILDDGACFYRAFGNSLLYLSKIKNIKNLMKTPLDQLLHLEMLEVPSQSRLKHMRRHL